MCVLALPFPPKNGGGSGFPKTLGKGRRNLTISDEAEAGRGGESCPAFEPQTFVLRIASQSASK